MSHPSAIPDFYFAIFAYYEPFLCIAGFIGALSDPKSVHDQQAPWPSGSPPPDPLPLATAVTVMQLGHVCALLGVVNFFVLSATRRHLHAQVALQEKIVGALLTPLLLGDVLHLYVTFWALGDHKWREWNGMLWITVFLGLTLMVPRIAWHLGIGRYVDWRDGRLEKH
jgi:hypothetical protein